MEVSRTSSAIIVALLVSILVIWRFEIQDDDRENSVIVVTGDGQIAVEESSTLKTQTQQEDELSTARLYGNEREITEHVSKSTGGFDGLPITVYNLQAPLLPNARLLDFREFNKRLWFAGDAGLYSFDPDSERWFAKTKEEGLPRDTAYGIERMQSGLFLYLLDWNNKGHLTNNLSAEFDGENFYKTRITEITARTGGRAVPDKAPLEGKISDFDQVAELDWYCVRGKHAGAGKGFINGGVIKFNSVTKERTVFTENDGLLNSYCSSIASTSDQTIWISHWDEEVGLSYLAPNATHWQVKPSSANNIPLGGPSVYVYGEFLFIAQQRALVIYDPISDMAIEITEDLGLSGFIVTDVQATADGRIWATSYRYAPGGDGQAASGLISFKLADVVRLFKPENLENSLRNARKL